MIVEGLDIDQSILDDLRNRLEDLAKANVEIEKELRRLSYMSEGVPTVFQLLPPATRDKLNLTPQQVRAIGGIERDGNAQAMMLLTDDQRKIVFQQDYNFTSLFRDLTPEQRTAVLAIRNEMSKKLEKVLTPEQLSQLPKGKMKGSK